MTKLSQRIYCAEQIEVPSTLPPLIKQFTKEVIRYFGVRPNIVEFARDYFTASTNGELQAFLLMCESEALSSSAQVSQQAGPDRSQEKERSMQSRGATAMLRSVFNVLDRDLNDALTLEELKSGIDGTPLGDMWNPIFEQLIGDAETVDFETFLDWWTPIPDDKIDDIREEWLVNHFSKKHSPAVVDLLTRLFTKWDTDRSGTMSIEEVVNAMKNTSVFGSSADPVANAAIRKKNVARVMRSDTNADGLISVQEFLAFMDDGIPEAAVPDLLVALELTDIEDRDWGYTGAEA